MDDWYNRVVLNNYETKHKGKYGKKSFSKEEKELKELLEFKLSQTTDIKERTELNEQIENLGRQKYITKGILSLFTFIRLKALGWNLSSAMTNLFEGQIANDLMIAQTGMISEANWIKANSIIPFIISNRKTDDVIRTRVLMDRFDVLMDSRNEFQQALSRTSLSKIDKLGPYSLNTNTEYVNQSPLMIGLLMEEKIKSIDGEIESSVWNAMDKEGKLKEEFRTEENIQNWEELTGDQFTIFKSKLGKLIIDTHGDYSELGGTMIKSSITGKGLMMFKTWLPRAIYSRFATEHDDIETGIEGLKGRYRSHTALSAALHGGAIGTWMIGPFGALIGAGIGYLGGSLNKTNHSFIGQRIGDKDLGSLGERATELGLYLKILASRGVGIPVNRLLNKQLIKTNFSQELADAGFTEVDRRNIQANLSELALILSFMTLSLMIKAALWDDDDDEDDGRRQMHNLMINRIMQLGGQTTMYLNVIEMKDTATDYAFLKFIGQVITVGKDVQKYIDNDDILKTGPYKGKSRLLRDVKRTFLPSPIEPYLGFEKQMKTQFEQSPIDKWFWSEEKKEKNSIKGKRAARRKELQELYPDYTDKQITKLLNKEF